jgi:hypothetical protein
VPLRKVQLYTQSSFLVNQVGTTLTKLLWIIQIMIVDYKLTYPSGTATAYLINGFHTPQGAKLARWIYSNVHLYSILWNTNCKVYRCFFCSFYRKQVKKLGTFFVLSFVWGFFQWFYTANSDECGFQQFPSLGLQAYNNR